MKVLRYLSLRSRLLRLTYVPRIALHMRVRVVQKGYVRLYGAGCSPEEWGEVESVDELSLTTLANQIRCIAGVAKQIPELRIACLGRGACMDSMPVEIKGVVGRGAQGMWMSGADLGVAGFGNEMPIREVILHELTYALLDRLTGGFPYRCAIVEGFARYLESLPRGYSRNNQAPLRGIRYLDDSECVSISDLLAREVTRDVLTRPDLLRGFSDLTLWFILYLARLGSVYPSMWKMLFRLWQEDISSPEGVYGWLLKTVEMDAAAFERSFRSFCTTGVAYVRGGEVQ